MRRADDDPVWPALPYEEWNTTLTTLHMWLQIVGKVKLELTPFLNDWLNVAFNVTARGLTTSNIPIAQRVFQVDFDLTDHQLIIATSDGGTARRRWSDARSPTSTTSSWHIWHRSASRWRSTRILSKSTITLRSTRTARTPPMTPATSTAVGEYWSV